MKNFIEINDRKNKNTIININTITSINLNTNGDYTLWFVNGKYLTITKESYEKLRAVILEINEEDKSE